MRKFAGMKQTVVSIILFLGAAIPFPGALTLQAHPLHLSVTNITYENGTLKVLMKTFRDDWEIAYFHYHSQVIDFTERENREAPWFLDYLENRFSIATGSGEKALPMVIDSVTVEGDDMAIRMHALAPGEPNSLYIYNALLTDIYPDQTNLVIFGDGKRQTGIKFDVKKHDEEVPLR